ncbi:MAG: PIN domain-containing protein [Chloroflexi bacterium]|nr:PIN domain-containing protein [Chloroflexota bacterium]
MRSVSRGFLTDSNILVYVHDPRDVEKQRKAESLLDELIETGQCILSVQCLTEFFSVVTRRLPDPMTSVDALVQVSKLIRSCEILDLTPEAALEGFRGVVQYRMSIWDSLIWAVAKLNQVRYILTEDAEHGRFLEGVHYLNPFHADFELSSI